MDVKSHMATEMSMVAIRLLLKYGEHTKDCEYLSEKGCTCGWESNAPISGWKPALEREMERRKGLK